MNSFDLDPEYVAFIEQYREVSGLSTATTIEQQRSDYEAVVQHFRYPHPAGLQIHDSIADGRHGKIPLRHYGCQKGHEHTRIMFVHGGGFILGSLDSHDDICAELCARTGIDLVSVDYRLAPEYLHPIQLDDVEDAFTACRHRRTILVGASAGGTLCAALCQRLKSKPVKATGQVLIYPGLGGDSFDLDSYRVNADAPLLTTEDIRFYRAIRCKDDRLTTTDPEFSPLLADDFSNTPATIPFSADVDPLRDDAAHYVENLRAAGVDAEWINETGLTHDYLRARHISAKARAAFTRICDAITRLAS